MNELQFIGFFLEEIAYRYEMILEKLADFNKDVRFQIKKNGEGFDLYMNETCMKSFIRNVL